jgi:hypothetical protein
MCYSNLQTGGTPVTKLDSVERLTERIDREWLYGVLSTLQLKMIRAALTEMWDLSRREALQEAAKVAKGLSYVSTAGDIVEALERLAVEEGTK